MDYQAAIAHLHSFADFERDPGRDQSGSAFELGRIRDLLADLGDPQATTPVVHLAGTKGKGSTAALIEGVLRGLGLTTGLYTSPHLHDFAERIRIDGRPADPALLTAGVEALRPRIDPRRRAPAEGGLTTFEITTALAFWCFRQAGVDVQVVETGLGGRLDATNVVEPDVAVITPIGYDHQAILGPDLRSIAGEKAGILKPGCRVILGEQPEPALEVLIDRCRQLSLRPWLLGREVGVEVGLISLSGEEVVVRTPGSPPGGYRGRVGLIGRHQAQNAAVAIAAVEQLLMSRPELGDLLPELPDALVQVLPAVRWPGRFEVIHRRPWIVADGAHTGESAATVRETVRALWPGRRATILIGTARDKSVEALVASLEPIALGFLVTAADQPRALPAETLAARVRAAGAACRVVASTRTGLDGWLAAARAEDVLVATGSLFVAAEALRWRLALGAGRAAVDDEDSPQRHKETKSKM